MEIDSTPFDVLVRLDNGVAEPVRAGRHASISRQWSVTAAVLRPTTKSVDAPGMPDDRRMPTTTLEGWHRFAFDDRPTVTLLADDDWKALDEHARDVYNEARVDCHSELIIVETLTRRVGSCPRPSRSAGLAGTCRCLPWRDGSTRLPL